MTLTEDRHVLGRDEELARLGAFLDRVAVGPAGLVLDGEAGIGKTELWRSAVAGAREGGYAVLEARPSEAERELTFAGLSDLLAGLGDEITALPAPRRRPLSVALLLEESGGSPPDARGIAVATLELMRRLASRGPLLVAIDDVQWLDRASAAALAFALRRAPPERVGVLLACRAGEPAALELDRTSDPERLVVRPLSLGAVRLVLGQRLGVTFPRATLRRLYERSGGNPFFALELGRALRDRVGALGPGDDLPVPVDLARLLRERLASLPPGTAEPLAAVAALAEPARRFVEADGALDPAFAAGVLVLEGDRVRFAHPLLAAAAYEALPPAARLALHRRLADVVADPEQRARHLALGAVGPDPALAAVLDEAATRALARGHPRPLPRSPSMRCASTRPQRARPWPGA